MIPHKDIITFVHVAFMTPAVMKHFFLFPVGLIYTHFTGCEIELNIKQYLPS